mgnify:FL=1
MYLQWSITFDKLVHRFYFHSQIVFLVMSLYINVRLDLLSSSGKNEATKDISEMFACDGHDVDGWVG